jgi:methylglutaconyl-CoA hydratase
MTSTIHVTVAAGVATVVLNRPAVRNAFNAEMIGELTDTFSSLGRRDDVRAIVLRGNGASFSAGADVEWMRASLDFTAEENRADALRMSDMFAAITGVPQPVIACVHGAALGGGMGLIAVCDIVVAAAGTIFGFTETRLGIAPAVISRFVLPKIGETWARALYLTGERFDAEVARRTGLVHWIVPDDQLDIAVDRKVSELLRSGPLATRAAKQLIADLLALDDDRRRLHTAELIAALRTSPEGQEGLRAFLEKRPPDWMSETPRP